MIVALTNQGDVAHDQGRRDQAGGFYRQAADVAERILGPVHPVTRTAKARVESNQGR
jgi:hypothetical protein